MARGRPTGYRVEFNEQAAKLCKLGATDVDLADFFNVSIATIKRWGSQYPDFRASLKAGKDEADDRVERSLYLKAVGYTFDSEKVFNNQGQIVRAATREHVPPDTTAMIFWLKNRRPEAWRDKTEVDHNHRYENATEEELLQRINEIERDLGKPGGSRIN